MTLVSKENDLQEVLRVNVTSEFMNKNLITKQKQKSEVKPSL